MLRKKAVFNWSGGKDSAHALYRVLSSNEYDVVALVTTVNGSTEESTMHHIPLELLKLQCRSIGIPLFVVNLAPDGDMNDYMSAMGDVVRHFKALGVSHFIYGDIFLHDVRGYREELLKPFGIDLVEPLWGISSGDVIEAFLTTGLKTIIVTTMDDGLGKDAIGRTIDRVFIDSLPDSCDPNGENGEYHSFCYDGPIFSFPVRFSMDSPVRVGYDVGMSDGSKRTFYYWFGRLSMVK